MKGYDKGVFEIENRGDLPPGRVFLCDTCGTRLKEGQPHSSVQPKPHQSLTTLVVREALADDLKVYSAGSHAGITGYRPQLVPVGIVTASYRHTNPEERKRMGRVLERPLVQADSGYWEETKA